MRDQAASVLSNTSRSLEPMTIMDEDHVVSPVTADSSDDEFQEALETPTELPDVSTPSAVTREDPILETQPGPAVDETPSIHTSNLPAKTLTFKDVQTSYEDLLLDAKEVQGALSLFLNRSVP